MDEAIGSRSNFSTLNDPKRGDNLKYAPKAFSERGLYMLATTLKSPVATETAIAIIETFAQVKELARTIAQLHQHDEETQKSLLHASGEILSELLCNDLQTTETETTVKLNLAL